MARDAESGAAPIRVAVVVVVVDVAVVVDIPVIAAAVRSLQPVVEASKQTTTTKFYVPWLAYTDKNV